jgi:hypothetical protein
MKVHSSHPSPRFRPYGDGRERSSGHDPSVPKPASIVPGGDDVLSASAPAALFRNQQLGAQILTIQVEGEPGAKYYVRDSGEETPRRLYTKDPKTNALVLTDDYAQKGADDTWTRIKGPQQASGTGGIVVTPVKVAGDPTNYFIKHPGITSQSQYVFTKNGDVLKQYRKGIYNAKTGEVTLVDEMKGGAIERGPWRPWERSDGSSAANVTKAQKITEAQSKVDKARDELREKRDAKIKAQAEVKNVEGKVGESKLDFESKQAAEVELMKKQDKARDAVSGAERTLSDAMEALQAAERNGSKADIVAAKRVFDAAVGAYETANGVSTAVYVAVELARTTATAAKRALDAQQTKLVRVESDFKTVEADYQQAIEHEQALKKELDTVKRS